MRIVLSLMLIVGIMFAISTAGAFEVSGLATPESIIVDPATGDYYISNINGKPTDKDNNGFITRLDRTGRVTAKKLIEGAPLHAPKGMAIIGEVLYVSDIDVVRGFDKTTGNLTHLINLKPKGALFLNDLAADDKGNLYVSDSTVFVDAKALGTIFKIDTRNGHTASVFVRDAALGTPNGLIFDSKNSRLLANTWGEGKIVEISPEGKIKTLVAHHTWQNLDGIDFDNEGNLYLSSFTGGQIFRVTPDLKTTVVQTGLTTPADVNVDRKAGLLLIPSFMGDQVTTIPIH